jgi:hypothetical protein
MNKRERKEYVLRRARELARSGRFDRWLNIELELRFEEGFIEARQWLDDSFVRKELNRLCTEAREPAQDA